MSCLVDSVGDLEDLFAVGHVQISARDMARVGSGGEGSLYIILLEDLQMQLPLEHGCAIGCRCNVGFRF